MSTTGSTFNVPRSTFPEEARIRREIARLEAAYDEATEAGLRIARLAAARALRWALDGGEAPIGLTEVSRQKAVGSGQTAEVGNHAA